jgi:tetratricopeptide (TPR) repeat protein
LQASVDFDAKDYLTAIKGFTKTMQYTHDNKTMIDLLLSRADAYELLGNYHNALFDYDAVLDIDNKVVRIYEKRARAYFKINDYNAAIQDCDTILELDSRNIKAMYHKGLILEKQDDIFNAQTVIKKALDLNPAPELRKKMNTLLSKIKLRISDFYESSGDKYIYSKKYDHAYAEYSKAIELNPFNGKLFMKCGDTLRLAKNNEIAKKDYEQALLFLNSEQDIAAVFYRMGEIELRNKHYRDSINWLEEAVKLKNENVKKIKELLSEAYWNEGINLSNDGIQYMEQSGSFHDNQYMEATSCFDNAIIYNPSYYNQVYAEYSKAIELHPFNGKLLMKRGDASRLVRNNEIAKKDYEQALLLLNSEPDIATVFYGMGEIELGNKHYRDSINWLEKAMKLKNKNVKNIKELLSEAYWKEGINLSNDMKYNDMKHMEAASCFDNAIMYNPIYKVYKEAKKSEIISRAYRFRAYENHTKANYSQAIKDYNMALNYLPDAEEKNGIIYCLERAILKKNIALKQL